MTDLHFPDDRDTLKMIRETLCSAQSALNTYPDNDSTNRHRDRLDRMIAVIDVQRPLGANGKHGNLHTETCGCEDK